MDYFKLAVELSRAEAKATLDRIGNKSIALKTIKNRSQDVCGCSAYGFPHRTGGGQCPGKSSEKSIYDINREILRDFDRTEAQIINRGM